MDVGPVDMAIVDLLEEHEYDEHVQQLDERVRQYTGAPGMTPYDKAAGHYPPLLGQRGRPGGTETVWAFAVTLRG